MDFYTKYHKQLGLRISLLVVVPQLITIAAGWLLYELNVVSTLQLMLIVSTLILLSALLIAHTICQFAAAPVKKIWQAIQHIAPQGEPVAAPSLDDLRIGRELVANLANHVYQMASVVDSVQKTNAKQAQDVHSNFIANSLPLPLVVLDKADAIVYVNESASKYFGMPADDFSGKNIYTAFDMSFADDQTMTTWLKSVRQNSVTADKTWERVRIGLPGQNDTRQFDMAAHYNKSNPMGYETLLVLFDHTEVYSQDDQAMSFVALSVHELRTPLTLLRGYIEVFDEELGPNLNPELKSFMQKMEASAQQLAAFVDNILNVAKIEDNQLTLQLHEEKWDDVLNAVVNDVRLRANVRGITLKTDIATDLPTVGVDRYSIYEVVANLLDNAIKYSKGTKEIHISAFLDKGGMVETDVKDFGLGIDVSILPHIFDKFYRNHRNRAQIGGTGLGLYLSHAIVQAHGGQITVNSKVDEGSTFSFTVQPFAKLAAADKTGDTNGITRGAHGWIKNHSLYRD